MSKIIEAMMNADFAVQKAKNDIRRKKLCHYTSATGLLGVFEKEKPTLYFSQYDSLNDTKERKDVFEVLKKICDEWLMKQKMSPALHDIILAIEPSDLFGIVRNTNEELVLDSGEVVKNVKSFSFEECYTYICSFSENNDSLPMWRMYSKADHYEGYCIEFLTSLFLRKQNFNTGFTLEFVKVIYNESEKMELIEELLSPIAEKYDNASIKEKKDLITAVKIMIRNFQFIFKNKAFAYEEEIRAILRVPKSEKGYDGVISERKYRHSNGLIIPYVVYTLDPLVIKSITIAPTIKEDIARFNLKDYLHSKGLERVDIITSDIPIRTV